MGGGGRRDLVVFWFYEGNTKSIMDREKKTKAVVLQETRESRKLNSEIMRGH